MRGGTVEAFEGAPERSRVGRRRALTPLFGREPETMSDVDVISRDELKAALDSGEPIKLVMTLGDFGFRAKHIPGSLHIERPEDADQYLDLDDNIVVYCSDEACYASRLACRKFVERGFRHVRHYVGGVADWEDAGYPLEGEMA
jgi:rhodanese-related sulfurtransferase